MPEDLCLTQISENTKFLLKRYNNREDSETSGKTLRKYIFETKIDSRINRQKYQKLLQLRRDFFLAQCWRASQLRRMFSEMAHPIDLIPKMSDA